MNAALAAGSKTSSNKGPGLVCFSEDQPTLNRKRQIDPHADRQNESTNRGSRSDVLKITNSSKF
jgi:hypothetical protein